MLSVNSQASEEGRAQPAVGVLKGSRLIQQAQGLSGSSKTPEVSFPVSSTLLSGRKKRKTDSPVPRRRLSQLRGGDPRFVRPELILDLRGAGAVPGLRATCQSHRSPSLCPAAAPSTGGLLPDSAAVLISPAEPVCAENRGALGRPAGLPGTRPPGRRISVYPNARTRRPRSAPRLPAGGPLPLDCPFPRTHSLPGSDLPHWGLPPPPFPDGSTTKTLVSAVPVASSSPPAGLPGEEEGLKARWPLAAWRAVWETKQVPKH